MAKRRSRRERRAAATQPKAAAREAAAGGVPYLGRIPLPPKPEQVITPRPKRSDRAAEKRRLRRLARDPDRP